MIDSDLVEQLEPEVRYAVKAAFTNIANSGILELQLERNLHRLREGALTETDHQLMERVRVYRQANVNLMELREVATNLKQERNDESE